MLDSRYLVGLVLLRMREFYPHHKIADYYKSTPVIF